MSSDDLTLVERDPKTILVIFRESQSWLYRWYTWVDRSDAQQQVVKDILIEAPEVEGHRGASSSTALSSQHPAQKAFQFVANTYSSGDIVWQALGLLEEMKIHLLIRSYSIFGFGERGSYAAVQLAHLLHANFAADLCHFPGVKQSPASVEEASVVQCVAVNYNSNLTEPLNVLNNTISSLPPSVERVICTGEGEEKMFACSAIRDQHGRITPNEVWLFECAPAWRTNRYWLIKQTTDLIHYIPMHVKVWFDTIPKSSRRLEDSQHVNSAMTLGPEFKTSFFHTHRIHDDYIINILDDDEFDLRYHVWTT